MAPSNPKAVSGNKAPKERRASVYTRAGSVFRHGCLRKYLSRYGKFGNDAVFVVSMVARYLSESMLLQAYDFARQQDKTFITEQHLARARNELPECLIAFPGDIPFTRAEKRLPLRISSAKGKGKGKGKGKKAKRAAKTKGKTDDDVDVDAEAENGHAEVAADAEN